MPKYKNLKSILHQHPFQGCTCNTYIQGVSGCCDLDTAPSDVGSTIHLDHLRNILGFIPVLHSQLLCMQCRSANLSSKSISGKLLLQASTPPSFQFWRWFCSKC